MNIVIKIIAALFAITLYGFASLQFNDPDPVIWVGFYVICALVPTVLLFGKFPMPLFWLAVVICAAQLMIAGPGFYQYFLHRAEEPLMQAMDPDKPYIEEAREFLGTLIALAMDLLCLLLARASAKKQRASLD